MSALTKVILITTFIFYYLPQATFSQEPDVLWTKTIGGNNKDTGYNVKQTMDGGFIITGGTNSFGAGDYDVYLIKTNQDGDTLWTRTFGGVNQDYGSEVQQTADGGYIVIGLTKSFNNGVEDLYLIKTNDTGDTLWTKVYGGPWGDAGRSITQDAYGNFLATGYTMSFDPGNADVWILKFNEFGDTLWTRREGGSEVDNGTSIKQLENKNYIITGYTKSFSPSQDIYLIKIDTSGNTIWAHHYGREGLEFGEDVIELDDGGFAIAGYTTSYGTGYDCYLVRVNANGDTLWTKKYGGEFDDKAYAIELFEDGFAIAGYTNSVVVTGQNLLTIKTDMTGNIIWDKIIGGIYEDWIFGMDKTNDGGLILTGQSDVHGDGNHDVWLVRLDREPGTQITVESPNGGEIWLWGSTQDITWSSNNVIDVKIELSLNNGASWSTIIDSTANSGIYSWLVNPPQLSDQSLIRISDVTNENIVDQSDDVFYIDIAPGVEDKYSGMPGSYKLLQNYPNPFNPTTTIKFQIPELSFVTIKVYDVLGNEVVALINEEKPAGSYEVKFDATGLPNGIYFYRLQAGSFVETKKMILMK